jgi:plasmid replication initiation protein
MAETDQANDEKHPRRKSKIGGKDEMNLAEFPFASLKRQGDGRNVIEYEGWATDEQGNRYHHRWAASASALAGLPTEYDERIYVALMALTAQQGFESRKVTFSLAEVLRLLGVGDSQEDYKTVERALDRLVGVTIYSKDAFWDNEKQKRITTSKAFHLLETYWLRSKEEDEAVKKAEGVAAYVVWSEEVWRSFKTGYIKQLDLQFFFQLEYPTSRRLYRFLDKRMHYKPDYEIDIFELAGRLGMVRYHYPSDVLRKLKPAFDELIATGFLLSAQVINVNGYTRVHFVRAAEERAATATSSATTTDPLLLPPPAALEASPRAAAPESAHQPQITDLAALLTELGLGPRVAQRFVARYQRDYLLQKLDYLAFLQERNPRKVANPCGWLRRAIEQDYGAPDGYQLQAERLAEQAHAQERQAALFDTSDEHRPSQPPTWREWVIAQRELPAALVTLTDQLQARLKLQMTEATYQASLTTVLLTRVDDSHASLAVPMPQAAAWIANRLRPVIEKSLAQLVGHPIALEVETVAGPPPASA